MMGNEIKARYYQNRVYCFLALEILEIMTRSLQILGTIERKVVVQFEIQNRWWEFFESPAS
jgi:hypothetical protein